jgi:exodeoxyribonuclease V alpha subunit
MAQISTVSSTEVLAGLVDRVTFHNFDNGFCVLRVKARGQRDLITVIGHAAMISAGEFVQASGSWVNDRTHGVQFKASFLKATAPTTVEGIEKYLGSGMIRGIGPVYAKKLVRAFGEAVFDVIEQRPIRLREVTGIGPKRAERIIVDAHRPRRADAVAVQEQHDLADDPLLGPAGDDGHCGLPAEELVPLTQKLLEVPAELIATALDLELQDGTVIADDLDGRRCVLPVYTEPNGRSPKSCRGWQPESRRGHRDKHNPDGLYLACRERQLRPLLDPRDRFVSIYRLMR